MSKNHKIEMPEQFLIRIAVYGDMGDGELGEFMRQWARQECDKLGLSKLVSDGIEENFQGLRKRAKNILGESFVNEIEDITARLVPHINREIKAR